MSGDEGNLADELGEGDWLFQPDREMFYVVTDKSNGQLTFALHGWVSIGTERLENYLNGDDSADGKFLLTEEEMREKVDDPEAEEHLDKLKDMVFTVYAEPDKYADPEEPEDEA